MSAPRLLVPGAKLRSGGTYAGTLTDPQGRLYALVLQDRKPEARLPWLHAEAWAASDGVSDLPNRTESALLFAALRPQFERTWHWTNETHETDASYAWFCYFYDGHQLNTLKSYEGCARAVRRLVLESFDALAALADEVVS